MATVDIRTFLCNKCGAVCEVEYIPPVTPELEAEARVAVNTGSFGSWIPATNRLHAAQQFGEHLALKCLRCGWKGRHPVLEPEA